MKYQFNFFQKNTLTASSYPELIEQDIRTILEWPLEERSVSTYNNLRAQNYKLESDKDAIAFNAAFGSMHVLKIDHALSDATSKGLLKMDSLKNVSCLNIYDWGSGQGLATATTLEFLSKNGMLPEFVRVHLIEPSYIATQRAEALLENMKIALSISTLEVVSSNVNLDIESERQTVAMPTHGYTIHLFSNVLDLLTDIEGLGSLLKSDKSKQSLCLCIGPFDKGMSPFTRALFNQELSTTSMNLVAKGHDYKTGSIVLRNLKCTYLNFLLNK